MKAVPIRWKFAGWTAALTAFTMVVYSGFTLANFYTEQLEAVDMELKADGRRLTGLQEPALIQATAIESERYASWAAHAVFNPQDNLRYLSPRLPEALARAAQPVGKAHTVADSSGRWRLRTFEQSGVVVVMAYNLHEVDDIIGDLIFAYCLSIPAVVLIAAAGGWWVAGRALVPVRELATSVARVQAGKLDHRVPVPAARDDLQKLSVAFNAMLARLEQSFEQAQRFAADASHELRTPLTIIRGEVDRLLRAPGIGPDHQEKLVSVQEEIDRLQHITENLLLLARFDSGRVRFDSQALDFSALVSDACDDAELLGESQQVSVMRRVPPGIACRGDSAHLRRVVLNLLDNAVKFNFPGGTVDCQLATERGEIALRVTNTGPGIGPEQRGHLFQRFYRGDPSRNASRSGHGLGLSLSREIARAHGGDLQYEDAGDPQRTVFKFTLPPAAAIVTATTTPS